MSETGWICGISSQVSSRRDYLMGEPVPKYTAGRADILKRLISVPEFLHASLSCSSFQSL